MEYRIIKVSGKTPVPQLAGSIVISIENGDNIEMRAMGASSISQLYKACAVARGTLASKGKDLFIKPGFDEVIENGAKKTVLVAFIVMK